MQHFCFASKQVFYFTGLVHTTHVTVYELRTWVCRERHLVTAVMVSGHDSDVATHLARSSKYMTNKEFSFIVKIQWSFESITAAM